MINWLEGEDGLENNLQKALHKIEQEKQGAQKLNSQVHANCFKLPI